MRPKIGPGGRTIELLRSLKLSGEHLSELTSGSVARIAGVEAAQNAAKRLADMGFVRGAVVEMVRPGRPCLVRIGGTYVGLGLENQRSLIVEPV